MSIEIALLSDWNTFVSWISSWSRYCQSRFSRGVMTINVLIALMNIYDIWEFPPQITVSWLNINDYIYISFSARTIQKCTSTFCGVTRMPIKTYFLQFATSSQTFFIWLRKKSQNMLIFLPVYESHKSLIIFPPAFRVLNFVLKLDFLRSQRKLASHWNKNILKNKTNHSTKK